MEPISIVAAALGFIFKAVTGTKLVKDAENDALTRFWNWIKPGITEKVPQIEAKPEDPETITQTKEGLLELIKDQDFFEQLVLHVGLLQKAGITVKNEVNADLENIRIVRIGDRNYQPGESYDRKNIFTGKVSNVDEFNVGDINTNS